MPLLADLFQIAVLLTCLIGLGLAGRLVFPEVPFCLHFCFAPVALAAGLFFLEHFLPLGQLPWLWLPGLAISCWLIRNAEKTLWRESVFWYFLFGFGVCFFWRFTFPDLIAVSENLSDHAQLVSNSAGGLLPAEDIWVKGSKDDIYYVFQYYAAGLIHRFIGCGSGLTYQLGYCTMAGLTSAAMGGGVQAATRSIRAGWLASLFLVLGGNGATLVTPFMEKNTPSIFDSVHFVGGCALPVMPELKTAFGLWLINFIGPSRVDAPMEYYSFTLLLGDFHPPLSSMLFLALSILAIGVAERSPPGSLTDKVCSAAVMATPFLLIVSNTWTAPLQAILAAGWFLHRRCVGRGDAWPFLLVSCFVSFALIFPFFVQFAAEASNRNTFAWTPERAPFLNWVLVMLPACVIWLATLWAARRAPFARWVAKVALLTMLVTYFFHIDDGYGGAEAIFNSAMKWWPWVYTATVMLGLVCIWPHKLLRCIGVGLLFLSLAGNLSIFYFYWERTPKEHLGRLDGYAWFTDDLHQRSIYEELLSLPKGVVLESLLPHSAAPSLSIAQFTENYSPGACSWHEIQWRGGREDLNNLAENLDKFYNGAMAQPVSWLRGLVPGGVTYVVWLGRDNERGPRNWAKINDQIKDAYDWRDTFQDGDAHWGIWIQRPEGARSKD